MSQPCEMQTAVIATSPEFSEPLQIETAVRSKDDLLAPEFARGWSDILLGVAFGGAAYPIVVEVVAASIAIYYTLAYSSGFDLSQAVVVFTAGVYALVSSLI